MPTVTVQPSGAKVRVDEGKSILEGLYTAGYSYLIGCKRGGCAICKVDLLAGEVVYQEVVADSVLPQEEKDAGIALSCRAIPTGDVVIRVRRGEFRQANPFLAALYAAS